MQNGAAESQAIRPESQTYTGAGKTAARAAQTSTSESKASTQESQNGVSLVRALTGLTLASSDSILIDRSHNPIEVVEFFFPSGSILLVGSIPLVSPTDVPSLLILIH